MITGSADVHPWSVHDSAAAPGGGRHASVRRMTSLDDLPVHHPAHAIQVQAEAAFEAEILRVGLFARQQKDQGDYGSDYQLEVIDRDRRTNIRIHVQLKGTTDAANTDGSISISVARANLNYLLAPSDSIYACYRVAEGVLLARSAESVYAEYERSGRHWESQDTVTVRFSEPFDEDCQQRLHRIAMARARAARDTRLKWLTMPPERLADHMASEARTILVPAVPADAYVMLHALFDRAEDAVISAAHDQFRAVLDDVPSALDVLHMAEINIGLNGLPCNLDRVREALMYFEGQIGVDSQTTRANLLFTLGNAHLGLAEINDAIRRFEEAIRSLSPRDRRHIEAPCWKNLGAALERAGRWDEAKTAYETALAIDDMLAEAHFALGLWHMRRSGDLNTAIEHMDCVAAGPGSGLPMRTVHGWRASLLFQLGRLDDAFAAVDAVIAGERLGNWEWGWCASLVIRHGRHSMKALMFWRRYLRVHPGDLTALAEEFGTASALHERGVKTSINIERFRSMAISLLRHDDIDAALVWDRVGHWAQRGKQWIEAEAAFRLAFGLNPARYAYCLGVALNHLDRHRDALEVMLPETTRSDADSLVWFQVAFAEERVGDLRLAVEGYERAIAIEPEYALAHFNLGGVLRNKGDYARAIAVWVEAIHRFPDHNLAKKLQRDLPRLFGEGARKIDEG